MSGRRRNLTTHDYEKVLFFYVNAGYSYDPKTETRRRARYNNALDLSDAETRMIDSNILRVSWDIDQDIMSSDWITADDDCNGGHSDPWHTWQLAVEPDHDDGHGQYLGGIDFGRDGQPGADKSARVYIAELALEYMAESGAALVENLADCAALKLVTDAAEKYANLGLQVLPSFSYQDAILAAVARVRQ